MRFSWLLAVAACTPAVAPQPPPQTQQTQTQPMPSTGTPTAANQPTADAVFDEVNQPKGHLATSAIQKVVRADFGAMIACYEAGLAKNPRLPGSKIKVRLVIGTDGRVASATHDAGATTSRTTLSASLEGNEPPITDPAVIACVVTEFRRLAFPKPDGGIVVATYPLIFSSN